MQRLDLLHLGTESGNGWLDDFKQKGGGGAGAVAQPVTPLLGMPSF